MSSVKDYYAVARFDSVETECDGIEYELSATRIDLRVIPAEMPFSSPSSSCRLFLVLCSVSLK